MLKFKEIRHSIINKKDSNVYQPIGTPRNTTTNGPLTFRKTVFQAPLSPIKKDEHTQLSPYKY